MPSKSAYVDEQPSIHLEPHFAVVRSFEELRSILHDISDAESVLPNLVNIPVPESMMSSTINRYPTEYLVTSPAVTPSATRETAFPTDSRAADPIAVAEDTAVSPEANHTASTDSSPNTTGDAASPLTGSLSASPTGPAPRRNRILCVWDVDDTLVASGTSGVRQHPVFREAQMRSIFRDLEKAGTTRHLLLSQGSIDDVFAKDGTGRLRYLQKYFFSESDARSGDEGDQQGKGGFAGIFNCGNASRAKQRPSALRNPEMINRSTKVVRLNRIHSDPVSAAEVAWLDSDGHDAPKVANGSLSSRWLFVRPSLAGISLCSLNTPVQPSPYTAFVDGKALRKLDVVWSLAVSGHWDNVFFIDNNLSEVGVVTSNMQMSHLFDLQSEHKESRFFHNELTMLAVSSLIRSLCYQYGRDITVPPKSTEPIAESAPLPDSAPGTLSTPPTVSGVKNNEPFSPSTENTAPTVSCNSKDNVSDPQLPLTPSSSTESPSCENGGDTAAPRHRTRQGRHTDPAVIGDAMFTQPMPLAVNALSPVGATPDSDGAPQARVVRLVVANLHLPYETYKKLLTSRSSAADDGTGGASIVLNQRNVTRRPNNMAHAHYRGQPLFNKDTSCSDDQYESIIRMFRRHIAYILDLMVEDLRQQGYLVINPNSKYPASISQVMLNMYHVPNRIPCIKAPYQEVCRSIDQMVLTPLKKGGGTKEGVSTIKSCAHSLFQKLVQTSPLVDPLVIGSLCSILVEIYMEDGSVSKAQVKRLETELNYVFVRSSPA